MLQYKKFHDFKINLLCLLFLLIPIHLSFSFHFDNTNVDLLNKIDLNPGMNRYRDKPKMYFHIPLGLFSLLIAQRNPVLYFTDGEKFQDTFDLLSFYEQMSYLNLFLVNPAKSPDEIIFALNDEGLDIIFPDDETYTFSGLYWKPKLVPFIPGSFLKFILPIKPVYFCVDLYAGTSGLTLELDDNLSGLLENEELSPDTSYNIEALLSLRAGVAIQTTYIISLYSDDKWLELYFFDRVGIFSDLAFLITKLNLYFETNQENQPEIYSYTADILSGYPFKGIGLGFKNDIGINGILYNNLMISLICLNLFQGKVYRGDHERYTSVEQENTDFFDAINSFAIQPTFYVQVMYDFSPFIFELGFLIPSHPVDLYYDGSINLVLHPVTTGFSFTWRDYLAAKTFFSYTVSHIHVETGILTHQSPFIKKLVLGMFLSLGCIW